MFLASKPRPVEYTLLGMGFLLNRRLLYILAIAYPTLLVMYMYLTYLVTLLVAWPDPEI